MLLGPIDFSSNEIVKRIELCLSRCEGRSAPSSQPPRVASEALPRVCQAPSLFLRTWGETWGTCFIIGLSIGDIICEIKRGDPGSNITEDFNTETAAEAHTKPRAWGMARGRVPGRYQGLQREALRKDRQGHHWAFSPIPCALRAPLPHSAVSFLLGSSPAC